MRAYFFIFFTIILTVYGQLIVKARALNYSTCSQGIIFLIKMFQDPWVLSGLLAALVASATWMIAIQNSNLSVMYPLMALTFVLIPLFTVWLFGEQISRGQVFGLFLIVIGIAFSSRQI